MSATKDYYERRAAELSLDIELTEETIDKIALADIEEAERIELSTLEEDM